MATEKEVESEPPPTTKPPDRAKNLVDSAILLAGGSASLYALGWSYLSGYLDFYGLSVTVSGLSFDQVVAGTWWLSLIVLIVAVQIAVPIIDHPRTIGQGSLSAAGLALGVAATAVGLTLALPLQLWQKGLVAPGIIIVGLFAHHRLADFEIRYGSWLALDRPSGRLATGLTLLVAGLLAYSWLGERRARRQINRLDGVCITTTAVHGQLDSTFVVVTKTEGLVYLAPLEAFDPDRPTTYLVEEAQLAGSRLSRCEDAD